MNPFSCLEVEGIDDSTNNPERKLSKMKRRYSEKPTPDLKFRIDSMEQRLNPKPKKSKKKKKKKLDDIDLETEYQKNRAHWEEYRRNQSEEEKRKEKKREKKEERKRRYYKGSESNSFKVKYDLFTTPLPQDIQDFLNSEIPDKKKYNKLCLRYHPDKGGDEEMFKIINNYMNT